MPVIFQIVTVPETLRCFFTDHVLYQLSEGFEVHAVSSPGEVLDRFAAQTGAICHSVTMARKVSPVADLVALARLIRVLLNEQPTIVHCHTPKAGLLGSIASWITAVPVRFYTIHGLVYETRRGWMRGVLKGTERLSCILANRVLCVSTSLMEAVIAEGLCPAEKLGVVVDGSFGGVDVERFRRNTETLGAASAVRESLAIPLDAPVVGYTGRLVREKGIEELGDAWRVLREEFDDLHLLLVGRFEPQDPISPSMRVLFDADSRVHVVEWQDDVVPYILATDVQCLPSHREGFPMVLVESAALEVPTVATRIIGCSDAVADGITGLLFSVGRVDELMDALRRLLRNADLRSSLGRAGRRRVVDRFRKDLLLEGLVYEYRDFLKKKTPYYSCYGR
jgi:glycosyltransferase involved in cell wall biosynthesis